MPTVRADLPPDILKIFQLSPFRQYDEQGRGQQTMISRPGNQLRHSLGHPLKLVLQTRESEILILSEATGKDPERTRLRLLPSESKINCDMRADMNLTAGHEDSATLSGSNVERWYSCMLHIPFSSGKIISLKRAS